MSRAARVERRKTGTLREMLAKCKALTRAFKRELAVYRLVLADARTPRASKLFLSAAIGYVLLPFNLIPDFIPVLGQLDDLLIVPALVWLALKFVPREGIDECRCKAESA